MKKFMNLLVLGVALTAFAGCHKKDDAKKEPKKEHKSKKSSKKSAGKKKAAVKKYDK